MEPPSGNLDFAAYFAAIAAIAATLFAVLAAATQIVKVQQDHESTHHRHLALLSALGELMAASLASSAMLLPGKLVGGFVDGRLVGLLFASALGLIPLTLYLVAVRREASARPWSVKRSSLEHPFDKRQVRWSWLTAIAMACMVAAGLSAPQPDVRGSLVAVSATWLVFSGAFECFYFMNPEMVFIPPRAALGEAVRPTLASVKEVGQVVSHAVPGEGEMGSGDCLGRDA